MECFVDYVEIGKRVRLIRKSKKWTQAKLAEAVGCSTANITNIEKAKTKLSLNMLLRISEVLQVGVDEIVGSKKTPDAGGLSPIEIEIRNICAGLSSEHAQICRQVCLEFCTAFSQQFAQV